MSRLWLLAPAVLAACAPDYLLGEKDDDAEVPTDTDAASPLDTDRPHRPHRPKDTDVPVDSAPPQDDTPPVDTEVDTDTAPPIATFSMYAHTADTLFSVDPAQNLVSRVGPFKKRNGTPVEMVDIAIDLGGHLYAGSSATTASGWNTLYSVDPTTARVTRVCDVPVTPTGLTFLSDGRLVAGSGSTLTIIDLSAGCATSVLVQSASYSTSGDVVGLPDGNLYWTVLGSSGDQLVRVDPVARTATVVGSTGISSFYGLGYDETAGVLYGFSANSGKIHTIDPATAHTARVPGATTRVWWGATTNPVVW
jgi:hypothetical protein